VSRPHHVGRRRAPGPVRRLPDGFPRLGATLAAKSVATVGVVGGAAVALALPVDASPASLSLPVGATTDTQDRAGVQSASRSAARPAAAPAPAVSAPVDAAPVVPDTVGVAGVTAVAKPKPKPKPTAEPTKESTASTSSSSPRVAVSASGISSKCSSIGLTINAARLCTAVQRTFGLSSIGGYRPNAGEHSTGQAVDFMTDGSTGDAIAEFVQANAGTYNVKYVIWEQRYWEPGSSWELMEDRGSVTANHYDHVHVTVN
jgi:hypothetical protein